MAKALGVTLPSFMPKEKEVLPEIWEKYRHLYPEDWIIEPKWIVCPDRNHPQGIQKWDTEKKEKLSGPATLSDFNLDGCPEEPAEERARCYAENSARSITKNYARFGYFTKEDVYKDRRKGCWGVVKISTPQQKFKEDVRYAKVRRDDSFLFLSDKEIRMQAPDTGWLSLFYGEGATSPQHEKESYHRGLVVKLSGDFNRTIPHNTFAVITEVIDPWHFRVYFDAGDTMIVRDTDVKGWIGDDTTDYAKFGEDWRRKELIPFIRRALTTHRRSR